MLRLQVIAPGHKTPQVLGVLEHTTATANLAIIEGAGRSPAGDLILCDLVEEAASDILETLRGLGLAHDGAVSIHPLEAVLSEADLRAARETPGGAADAVVWPAVDEEIMRHAEPSVTFYLLMVIATLIASIGLLTDSIVLIVGAMIVGPEYHALSAISWGIVRGRRSVARGALVSIVAGFPLAILITAGITAVVHTLGLLPDSADPATRILTTFVAEPSQTSVWVALLAGTAGMVAILGGGSGTLLGVLVSVTTVPAAANVGLGIAYAESDQIIGAGLQLAVNLVCIVLAGIVVLAVARRLDRGIRSRPLEAARGRWPRARSRSRG